MRSPPAALGPGLILSAVPTEKLVEELKSRHDVIKTRLDPDVPFTVQSPAPADLLLVVD